MSLIFGSSTPPFKSPITISFIWSHGTGKPPHQTERYDDRVDFVVFFPKLETYTVFLVIILSPRRDTTALDVAGFYLS